MLLRAVDYSRFKQYKTDLGATIDPFENTSSPRDPGLFLEAVLALHSRDPDLGHFLLDLMRNSELPDTPPGVDVASNSGTFPGMVTNDMAVVWGPYVTYILVFMSEGVETVEHRTRAASSVAALVHHYLNRVHPPPWVYPRRVP